MEYSQGMDVCNKFSGLQVMGSRCQHPQEAHESIGGKHNLAGDFLSKDTACYPDSLATTFATLIDPLLSDHHRHLPWPFSNFILPSKGHNAFPKSSEDGGGLFPYLIGVRPTAKP